MKQYKDMKVIQQLTICLWHITVLSLSEKTKHTEFFRYNKSPDIAAPRKILQGKWVLQCTKFQVDDAMIE